MTSDFQTLDFRIMDEIMALHKILSKDLESFVKEQNLNPCPLNSILIHLTFFECSQSGDRIRIIIKCYF